MPKAMRHAALRACLSLKAKEQAIVGLESYPETVKTKDAASLLKKISLELGRRILIVVPATHRSLMLSIRNIPNVKTLVASYLNPEDVIAARHLVFMDGAIEKAQEVFGKRERVRVAGKRSVAVAEVQAEETPKKAAKKPAAKKAAPKKKSSPKAS
jgi:large subunit ribosomal protein L4